MENYPSDLGVVLSQGLHRVMVILIQMDIIMDVLLQSTKASISREI